MKTRIFKVALATLFFASLYIGCTKEEDKVLNISDTDVNEELSDNYADALVETVNDNTDEEIYKLDLSGYQNPNKQGDVCRIITVNHPDNTTFPKEITIDYGTGCTVVANGDSITRKGKIKIVVTGRYYLQGSSRTVTFDNFYVNDIKFEGTRTVTALGKDASQNYSWTVTLVGGKLIFPDGTTVTRETNRKRTLVTNGTAMLEDDYVLLEGTVSGINYKGETYKREILTALRKNRGCPFFSSGIIEITRNLTKVVTIDFGDGTCDRTATLTKNGETRTIQLKWRRF